MQVNEKSISEQIDDLGVDTNILYEIGGTLDNLKVLIDVIDEYSELLQRQLERTNAAPYICDKSKDIRQLLFIVDDEYKNAQESLKKLLDQIHENSW